MATPRTATVLTEFDGWPDGPKRTLLLGPPGTGKTYAALETWIVRALESGCPISGMCVCAFSRAAAGELRERIRKKFQISEREIKEAVATIHSISWRLIGGANAIYRFGRGFVKSRGRNDDPTPDERFTETPQLRTARNADPLIQEFGEVRLRAALRVHDLVRHRRRPESFLEIARNIAPRYRPDELGYVIRRYEQEKAAADAVDFTDVLERALETEAPIGQRLLVVDEAQDLTPLMWSVLDHWFRRSHTVVIIGDPDQSVYSFGGVRPESLKQISAKFEVRYLAKSRRVPRAPHELARRVIQPCRDRIDAPWEPADRVGSVLRMSVKDTLARLKKATQEGQSTFVLARTGFRAREWARRLRELGMAHTLETDRARATTAGGAIRGKARRVLRAIVDLRLGNAPSPTDLTALVEALPVKKTQSRFFLDRRRVSIPFGEPVSVAAFQERGVNFRPLIESPSVSSAAELARLPLASIHADLALLERYGPAALADEPFITITTMHRSKGRERELVVVDLDLPKMIAKKWRRNPRLVDDERRVLYVAITRTIDELVLVPGGYDRLVS